MKSIEQLNLRGKKVIIRVDFNVPIKDGVITSDKRILEALPTINYALSQNAKIILISHLGRIKTEEDKPKKSLRLVGQKLSNLLNKPVLFCPVATGDIVTHAVNKLNDGDILMLENTRYEDLNNKAESKNNPELGKFWASLGDVFINDAFGTAHRAHASNVGITENIREAAVGFLVAKEIKMLSRAVENPEHPAIAIIGGAKVSDKIKVIRNLALKYDKVIIGGGMAYTFLKAQGYTIGSSLVEEDQIQTAADLLNEFGSKIILPIDNLISTEYANTTPSVNTLKCPNIPEGYMGLDIGPKSIELFSKELEGAKTVVWNGPLGVTEFSNYSKGTEMVAKAIASQPGVFSIIGGGDSAAAAINLGLSDKFSHISTGGGASLCFLEGTPLPGIDAIKQKA